MLFLSAATSTTSRLLTTLVGQYNVFERTNVDASDLYGKMASSSEQQRRMEFRNDYLWMVVVPPVDGTSGGTNTGSERNEYLTTNSDSNDFCAAHLPLLASTERLLEILLEPRPESRHVPTDEGDAIEDDATTIRGDLAEVTMNQLGNTTDLVLLHDVGLLATLDHFGGTSREAAVASSKDQRDETSDSPTSTTVSTSANSTTSVIGDVIEEGGNCATVQVSNKSPQGDNKDPNDGEDYIESNIRASNSHPIQNAAGPFKRPKESSHSAVDADDGSYQQLVRGHNLTDAILKALSDIYTLKQQQAQRVNAEEKSNRQHLPRNQYRDKVRHMALEHQRNRLQQQKRIQENSVAESSTIIPVIHDDDDDLAASTTRSSNLNAAPENGDPPSTVSEIDEAEDGINSTSRAERNPWVDMVAALNSLRVVTLILLDIVFHERRNDKKLLINGVGLPRNRDGKAKCWLLGTHVYDIAPVAQCKAILGRLVDLYYFIGAPSFVLPPPSLTVQEKNDLLRRCTSSLDEAMAQLVEEYNRIALTMRDPINVDPPIWVNQHPFDIMDQSDHLKLLLATSLLDSQFDLVSQATTEDASKHAAYLESIKGLHIFLQKHLLRRFTNSRISVYGSCLADLSLGKDADVDLSLHIEALAGSKQQFEEGTMTVAKYQAEMKRYVYMTCRCLESRKSEIRNMVPVTRARVPVCKGTYIHAGNPHSTDGSIDFDICFLNDIAVRNSGLLREYSQVDKRIKSLMVTVKRWAKYQGIGTTQSNCLSSYAWMNLVIFYVQSIGLAPNLQCPVLMEKVGVSPDTRSEYWHSVNNLDTFYLTWEQSSSVWKSPEKLQPLSVTALLYGFFQFYAVQFPTSLYCISIKRGGGALIHLPKTAFPKSNLFWCIEDPFETFDSYCPHDLGMPASETGARKIVQSIRSAESHLRKQMLSTLEEGYVNGSIASLWPEPDNDNSALQAKGSEGKKEDGTRFKAPGRQNVQRVPKEVEASGHNRKGASIQRPSAGIQQVGNGDNNESSRRRRKTQQKGADSHTNGVSIEQPAGRISGDTNPQSPRNLQQTSTEKQSHLQRPKKTKNQVRRSQQEAPKANSGSGRQREEVKATKRHPAGEVGAAGSGHLQEQRAEAQVVPSESRVPPKASTKKGPPQSRRGPPPKRPHQSSTK